MVTGNFISCARKHENLQNVVNVGDNKDFFKEIKGGEVSGAILLITNF